MGMGMQLPATLPTLDVLTPYCFMCSDPTAPSFTSAEYGSVIPPSQAGKVSVLRTPSGEAQSMLFTALASAVKMAPLEFNPNPPLSSGELRSRQFLGWQLTGGAFSAVILNKGRATLLKMGFAVANL